MEELDQRAIPAPLGAVGAGARIELAVGQRVQHFRRPGQQQRAAVEAQREGISHEVNYTQPPPFSGGS